MSVSGLNITRQIADVKVTVTNDEIIEHISKMPVDERIVLIRKVFEKDASKSFLLRLLNDLIAKK